MSVIVKLKDNQNKLHWLLKEYLQEGRIVQDFDEIDGVAQQSINFNEVNELIEKNREKSKEFLVKALGFESEEEI